MNKPPVLDLKYEIKKEILNIVLSSDGDLDKMNIYNLINMCKQFETSTELKKNTAIEDLEKEQDAIWERMNRLRAK